MIRVLYGFYTGFIRVSPHRIVTRIINTLFLRNNFLKFIRMKTTIFQLPNAVARLDEKLTNIERLLHKRCNDFKPESGLLLERKSLHSIRELAAFIGCSRSTAGKIKKSGKLRYYQINRKLLFFTADILSAMEQGKQTGRKQ